MKSLKEFIPLWKLIKEEKVKLIVASSLILIAGIAEIATGYLNGAAVESITNMALKNAVIYLLIYLGIELLSHAIIENYAGAMLEKIESKLTRKLGYYTYEKALNMPSYAYEEKTSGEVINRITTDADSLSFSFGHLLSAVSSLIGSLVVIIYIFINSWIVGLEIVIFVLLLFLIIRKYNPILKQAHKERKEKQDNFTSLVTESIRGIREIKTLGIKNSLLKDMTDIIKSIFQKSKNEIDVRKGFTLQTRILKGFLEVGVFITCVILIYYKQISLTFFISMTYYVYRYMWLIENFNNLTQTYQKLVVSLGRVNEILENRLYEDEKYGEKEISKTKGIIEFKDVTFGYPNEQITLNKFNLVLEPNKKIAIVGKSGQGKSTLFNLITRIFDPIEGQILLDGVNIKDLTEISLRKNISIIRQEPFIFNRTIKEKHSIIE